MKHVGTGSFFYGGHIGSMRMRASPAPLFFSFQTDPTRIPGEWAKQTRLSSCSRKRSRSVPHVQRSWPSILGLMESAAMLDLGS